MSSLRFRRPRALAMTAAILVIAAASIAGCGVLGGIGAGGLDGGRVSTVGRVDFDTPLKIPPLADSAVDSEGVRVFDLTAAPSTSGLLPGVSTETWGYNGSHLGPTLVADRDERVRVDFHNELDATTTLHWHGMHLPAAMDGGPHQPVDPGDDWSPQWTIDQPAATLWYHPHAHGATSGQVARGLAGMFILRDAEEAKIQLPRDYGIDDIPVIVQDARFDDDGNLSDDNRGFVGSLGDTLLVNGTIGPYLEVSTEAVRLRLLNASTARSYDFTLADGREFDQVASDGGLLAEPFSTRSVPLSPGERAEIVVRLVAGESVVLRSGPPELGTSDDGAGARNGGADSFDVLELRASSALSSSGPVPGRLASFERMRADDATRELDISLDGFVIDQQPMDMSRIDQVVEVGSTEIWTVRNGMDLPHNFDVHDVQFQVLDIAGAPPPPHLAGWKDTVYLRPQTDYRLIMRFEDYTDATTPYMYHCHLLWHEDQGMMGQYVVVDPGQSAGTIEGESHDHH